MRKLVEDWEGDCKCCYCRPRHPQSQGLVEQSNGTAENRLAAMIEQFKQRDWVKLIPKLQYIMNTTKVTCKCENFFCCYLLVRP